MSVLWRPVSAPCYGLGKRPPGHCKAVFGLAIRFTTDPAFFHHCDGRTPTVLSPFTGKTPLSDALQGRQFPNPDDAPAWRRYGIRQQLIFEGFFFFRKPIFRCLRPGPAPGDARIDEAGTGQGWSSTQVFRPIGTPVVRWPCAVASGQRATHWFPLEVGRISGFLSTF